MWDCFAPHSKESEYAVCCSVGQFQKLRVCMPAATPTLCATPVQHVSTLQCVKKSALVQDVGAVMEARKHKSSLTGALG